MNTKKMSRGLVLGTLAIAVFCGCAEESGDLGDDGAGAVQMEIKADTNNLISADMSLHSYAKEADTVTQKEAVLGRIKTRYPVAHISQEDLRNGVLAFSKAKAYFDPMVDTRNLPDAADADRLSRKQLSDLGLLPENENELVVAHIGGVNTAMSNPATGETTTFKNLVTVTYGREINGLPVVGHSKMVAQLGQNGEIASVIKKWTRVGAGTKIAKSELKSSADAVLEMKNSLQKRYTNDIDKIKEITVHKMNVVMYDDGNVIEPALYSEGEVANADGNIDKDYWITPILASPKAKYNLHETPADALRPQAAPSNLSGKIRSAR